MKFFRCFLLITLLQFFSFPIYSNNGIDSLLIQAQQNHSDGNYEEALDGYIESDKKLTDYFYNNYDDEIRSLYEIHEVDQKELQNRRNENHLLIVFFIYVILFLIIILIVYYILKRKNSALRKVREELFSAKQLAEYSIKNKSLLISNMSHEIRNPLSALKGFSEILCLEDIDDSYKKECTDVIKVNSELLLKLINDIVDVSALEVKAMEFNIAKCDVISLCRTIVKTMTKIKDTDADIILENEMESFIIMTDVSRLQQIIINLISNSVKFCKEGSITLSVKKDDDEFLIFTLTDTGCGISEENRNMIFERFEKLDENDCGTGLGLSICKLIISKLNGEIYLDSTYKQGARFVFTHPISQNL